MNLKFKHSGATGDIVFSLPTIKAMGGGTLYITNFHKQRSESIAKLIKEQSYIEDVIITDGHVDAINLDLFRNHVHHHYSIIKAHFVGQGIPIDHSYRDGWLTLPETNYHLEPYCVINRTTNYADPNFDWAKEVDYLHTLAPKVYFIGYKEEHELFEKTFNRSVIFHECDFLEGAFFIRDAVMFSGCYSAWSTIAMGLGRTYRLEQAPGHTCSTLFDKRETLINV